MSANDEFRAQDTNTDDVVQGSDTIDNDYASRTGQSEIPVVKDETAIEQPLGSDPGSDQALGMSTLSHEIIDPSASSASPTRRFPYSPFLLSTVILHRHHILYPTIITD
jgi:hypothetical protein